MNRRSSIQCTLPGAVCLASTASAQDNPIKVGMVGLDTSHVTAFTAILNDPKRISELAILPGPPVSQLRRIILRIYGMDSTPKTIKNATVN